MALFKLVAPSAHTGGVDKVFGQDWNDLINTLTGGLANPITLTGGLTMSGSDITLAGNKIKTTSFNMFESSAGGNNGVSLTVPGSGNSVSNIYPGGANVGSITQYFRTSDVTTNWEMLQIGSDFQTSQHYSIYSLKGGTGSLRPIDIGIGATKLMSFDVANTITSYVNFLMSGAFTIVPFVKAGTVSDADFTTPTSGMIAIDTTNSKIWVRIGTVWKSVAVT